MRVLVCGSRDFDDQTFVGVILEGKPDIVVAFVNKPLEESLGTAHMVRIARAAGVRTYVVSTA